MSAHVPDMWSTSSRRGQPCVMLRHTELTQLIELTQGLTRPDPICWAAPLLGLTQINFVVRSMGLMGRLYNWTNVLANLLDGPFFKFGLLAF
ncbi:hypothetical protein LIER_17506 [Lithospermum erythrorhizon]|uniref:Uncharacterized protein n=1 Tax=Lithospermum erythrorhizon TaxID=34254 RepID=A0AAV3QG06_LITER